MRWFTALTLLASITAFADPAGDREKLREVYAKRFMDVPLSAHIDGAYALNADAREQWLELEDFPPYEIAVDDGEVLWDTAFADGGSYDSCFAGSGKHDYPQYDEARGTVVTVEMAVNECREAHGEAPLPFDGEAMSNLTSYMAYQSRGEMIEVAEPASAGALAAYEDGKRFYQSRRGQLDFACSHCHVQLVGNNLRSEVLSATIGQVSHWPVYRLKWQEVGPLHLRFQECNSQVGAEPLPLQSEAYRNLEYFLTYISNGLEWNGPGTRK